MKGREGYVYIAGPYTDKGYTHSYQGYHEIEANIGRAREAAAFLATNGICYFCPHLNSAHFEVIVPKIPLEYWYEQDIRLLKGATAILLLEGYERSSGTKREMDIAEVELQIPVFLPEERERLVAWWKEAC